VQVPADELENAFEDGGVKEERRPQVEPEAVGFDRRAPPADAGQTLDDFDVQAGTGEQERSRKAAGAGPDDQDPAAAASRGWNCGKAFDGYILAVDGVQGSPDQDTLRANPARNDTSIF
jgi:hypothetical protein